MLGQLHLLDEQLSSAHSQVEDLMEAAWVRAPWRHRARWTDCARVPLADEWLATTIARAETAFLLTATPAGVGDVSYRNVRRDRHARLDALLQNDEPFAVQGTVPCDGGSAERLTALCLPRTPRPDRQRINSADPISVQHPQ